MTDPPSPPPTARRESPDSAPTAAETDRARTERGAENQNPETSPQVLLTRHYRSISVRLERLFRHELRGILGSSLLQVELVRRFSKKGDAGRVDQHIGRCKAELDNVVSWTERRDRWLSHAAVESVAALGAFPEKQLVEDLPLLLRALGRSIKVPVDVELPPAERLDNEASVSGETRAALLTACLSLLDEVAGAKPPGANMAASVLLQDYRPRPARSSICMALQQGENSPAPEFSKVPIAIDLASALDPFITLEWSDSELKLAWPTTS